MRPLAKVGLVALGYVAAFVIASAVIAIRVALTSGPDAQASSGMYAAGDALLFLIVLGILGLAAVPLYALRSPAPLLAPWAMLSPLRRREDSRGSRSWRPR